MTKTWRVLLVVLLASAAPVLAGDGPTGFRDVPWGASESALRKFVRLEECYPADHLDYGTRRCRAADSEKIGDVPPQMLEFYLRGDRFVAWSVLSQSMHRSVMYSAFVSRYGKPTKETRTSAEWMGERGRLIMTADPRSDFVVAVANDEIAKREAEQKERAGKASKDF